MIQSTRTASKLPNTYSSQINHAAIFTGMSLIFAIFAFAGSFHSGDSEIDLKGEISAPRTVEFLDNPVRRRFIQKVYSMVTLQLALTAAIVVSMMKERKKFPQLTKICAISSLLSIIILSFIPHMFPYNGILFVFFTCCTGVTVGNVCVKYQEKQGPNLVLRAFAMTMCIFVGLTIFTMISRTDYQFLGPFLFTGLLILIMECLCAGFYGGKWTPIWFGALIFSGYIIYDTNQIVRRYHPRDWLRATLDLYLDIINLFLEILKLMAEDKD